MDPITEKLEAIRQAVAAPIHDDRRPPAEMLALSAGELATHRAAYTALGGPIKAEYDAINREVNRREFVVVRALEHIAAGHNVGDWMLASTPEVLDSHGPAIAKHRLQHDRHNARIKEWRAIQSGATPNARQLTIMDAVRKAISTGEYRNVNIIELVKADLGDFFSEDELTAVSGNTEHGDLGMEIYYARSAIDAARAREIERIAMRQFAVGRKFRRVTINRKDYTSAVIVSLDGPVVLSAKRGGKTFTITAAASSITIPADAKAEPMPMLAYA